MRRESSAGTRAESRVQARLLTALRDNDPLSRVQLADMLSVSRTRIAAKGGRLTEQGLVTEIGPAASR